VDGDQVPDAERLVAIYERLLAEFAGRWAAPASALPCLPSELRTALLSSTNKTNDPDRLERIKLAMIELASFVSEADAKLVTRYQEHPDAPLPEEQEALDHIQWSQAQIIAEIREEPYGPAVRLIRRTISKHPIAIGAVRPSLNAVEVDRALIRPIPVVGYFALLVAGLATKAIAGFRRWSDLRTTALWVCGVVAMLVLTTPTGWLYRWFLGNSVPSQSRADVKAVAFMFFTTAASFLGLYWLLRPRH